MPESQQRASWKREERGYLLLLMRTTWMSRAVSPYSKYLVSNSKHMEESHLDIDPVVEHTSSDI
jgi:hypothetical protein